MTELLREQMSAFLDDALSSEEAPLLLRRIHEDAELTRTYACYHLIGATLRNEPDGSARGHWSPKEWPARSNRGVAKSGLRDAAVQVDDPIALFSSLRKETAGASGSGVPTFIAWFLADRATRSSSPWSKVTTRDSARRP